MNTQQNSYSFSHLDDTVTTKLDSDGVVIVSMANTQLTNCVVTVLPAVVNSDYTVTIAVQLLAWTVRVIV